MVNPLEFDDGNGTTALCIGVVVRGGARAFTTKSGSGQMLIARDCRTYDMTVAVFDAAESTAIVSENHLDSGSAAISVGAGVVTVRNAA